MNNAVVLTTSHVSKPKLRLKLRKKRDHGDYYLNLEYRNTIPHPSKRSDR